MDIDEEEAVDETSESKDDESNTPEVKELKVISRLSSFQACFANTLCVYRHDGDIYVA